MLKWRVSSSLKSARPAPWLKPTYTLCCALRCKQEPIRKQVVRDQIVLVESVARDEGGVADAAAAEGLAGWQSVDEAAAGIDFPVTLAVFLDRIRVRSIAHDKEGLLTRRRQPEQVAKIRIHHVVDGRDSGGEQRRLQYALVQVADRCVPLVEIQRRSFSLNIAKKCSQINQ